MAADKNPGFVLLGCGGFWNEKSMTGENLVKDEFGPPPVNGIGDGDQDDTGDEVS